MAVIQTIRTKYAKLTSAIIVIALLGFILMDFGKSGGSRSTTIGEINGTKIDYTEYQARIEQQEAKIKQQNQLTSLSEAQSAQIRDNVWHQMVTEHLLADMNDKLGITVTQAELNDLLTGPNPDPMVRQQFADPKTGAFNPQEVSATIQQIKNDPKLKSNWEAFEHELVQRRYMEKFQGMVAGGLYVPTFVVNNLIEGQNQIANISYVKLPYTLVPDDQAKVSDAELTQYIKDHPKRFEVREASRSIEYVSFKILPSGKDTARVLNELNSIKSDFATTDDAAAYVGLHSQNAMEPQYYTADQLKTLPNAAELMNAPINSVVGPFYEGDGFMLAKVLEKSSFPDSVKCRHILVVTKQGDRSVLSDTAAKARIDSAIALLHSGVSFDSVALKYSDDPGSRTSGGVYEFTLAQKPGIAKEFGDFVFSGTPGSSKLVKVSNNNYSGYHYVEILNQSKPIPVTKIAFIQKELNPDKNTFNDIYSKASQFVTTVNAGTDFEKAAQAENLTVANGDGIDPNSYLIRGLGADRELVKWAADAKLGDISPIYTVGDQYVVAKLTGIQEPGLVQITDQNRPIISAYVMKEKKADLLSKKYKGTSLENIAAAAGQTVGVADSIRFLQSFIPGVGNEPAVIGYAFFKQLKTQTLSPAIPGQEGVYYLQVASRTTLPADPSLDPALIRKQWGMKLGRNAMQLLLNSMREAADVEDKRANLY